MKLDDFINHTGEWLRGTGPSSHIVMSTRVRLARNLQKLPLPNRAARKELDDVVASVHSAIDKIEYFKNATFFRMSELDNVDKQFLVERHLMSHEHSTNTDGKALIVSEEEILSVMINEEDHLRIQVMKSGFNLEETWQLIEGIDNTLSKQLDFAYSPQWG